MYLDTRWMFRVLPAVAAAVAGCGGWDDPGAAPASTALEPAAAVDTAERTTVQASTAADLDWLRQSDGDSPRFTLAVLPDTQYLIDEDRGNLEPIAAAFRFLRAPEAWERDPHNIRFMAQLGDVTEHGTADEMAQADLVFRALDGRMPYSVVAGNHDVNGRTDDQRGPSPFLTTFGPARFRRDPTFGGASPDGYNRYHVFTAAGRQWLVLALDWRLSSAGFAWAQQVIDRHPTTPVIVTTHEIAGAGDDGVAQLSGYGQRLWDQLIRKNDQIFLTLNGHFWPPGRTVMKNDAGHDVQIHITNYQDRYYGGSGMLRLYRFDIERNRIDVETVSPWILARPPEERNALERKEVELTDDANRFSVAIDFAQRFAGFAPAPVRPVRPVRDMLVPGTVGYWRFDGVATEGATVPDGTTIADASGRGNDLTVVRLDGRPQSLTWTGDHHADQPAHASLFIDGGFNPTRGAYLRTADGAPLNSMHFERGYTFEAFLKLPRSYNDGTHSWMGLLSWMGKAGDAGKTGGDPGEPVASLNLSPERFFQWISYPVPRNDSSTSWGHALPVETWIHVAVVNDGKRTIVYVDGSPIARNPRQPATGISTYGTPFVIGGTQSEGGFYQSFFGTVGDVRLVNRALRVREFMTTRDRR